MPFYYLHNKDSKPKSEEDFKYIYYVSDDLDLVNNPFVKFEDEPENEYCLHMATGKVALWVPDDEFIEIAGNEKSIKAKFKKIINDENYELWKNVNFD